MIGRAVSVKELICTLAWIVSKMVRGSNRQEIAARNMAISIPVGVLFQNIECRMDGYYWAWIAHHPRLEFTYFG